ncbi:MAG: hypothetical protein C4519_26950 [Desulfobacteraceae bacterium]|nr:MAG: hypothetical protein C4519_26950 [Desulfobacteraceae bacterium]
MTRHFFIRYFAVLFSGISTFVYVEFFPYEKMSPVAVFAIQVVIFLPIMMGLLKKESFLKLSFYALFGSTVGFIVICIRHNVSIWSISTLYWIALSLPAIILLNIVGKKINDFRRV